MHRLKTSMPVGLWLSTCGSRLLVLFLALRHPNYLVPGNAANYLDLAARLAVHNVYSFSNLPGSSEVLFPSGYPLFLAPFMSLGSHTVMAVAGIQTCLGILAVYGVWRWLLILTHRRGAIWGTALFSLDWVVLAHTPMILADGLMLVLLSFSFYFFWEAWTSGSLKAAAASGLLGGAAALVKPVCLYLPILFAWPWRRARKHLIVFLVAASLLPLGWMGRNFYQTQNFVFSSMGGWHLLNFVAANEEALRLKSTQNAMATALRARVDGAHPKGYANSVEQNKIYGQAGMAIIKAHPMLLVVQNTFGAIKLLGGSGVDLFYKLISWEHESAVPTQDNGPALNGSGTLELLRGHSALIIFEILYMIQLAVLYLFFIHGTLGLWGEGRRQEALILWAAVGYFLILTSHVGYYRYRLPMMPFLAAGAACGFSRIQTKPSE